MSARTIHPFPARMAPEIALDAIPPGSSGHQITVIDPMCGSGTVLAAAVERGQRAIGIDIDPLAVMMSQTAVADIDEAEFADSVARVISIASHDPGTPPWADPETDNFVDFWFGPKQRQQLVALASSITTSVTDEVQQTALKVALSRIIVTKSPQASLAADTSHSRPHRVQKSSDYDVVKGFQRSAMSLARLLERRNRGGSATASLGDSRCLMGVADRTADLAVTSPPYLNALDYLRGHKLALVWFGYSIPTIRELRRTSIGAERAPDLRLSPFAEELVADIVKSVDDPSVLPIHTLRRFADDMVRFASELRRVLKTSGTAVIVVGNSSLRGNYIRNDLITQRALEHFGFSLEQRLEREIPASSRYMAMSSSRGESSIGRRMRSEVVMTMTGA
jgi:DNA modification methylase